MTPLENLLLKWHHGSLTPEERAELNAWLATPEGRARLWEEFAFDADLLEALQAEKARVHALGQARAFETIEVGNQQVFEELPRAGGRAISSLLATLRWKIALTAAGGILVLSAVLFVPTGNRAIARIEGNGTGAAILRGSKSVAANGGQAVKSGDGIRTSVRAGATVVYHDEPTRLTLEPATHIRMEKSATGKRLELLRGTLAASVAPQPKGQPLIVVTPHAEARVLGTEFLLAVEPQSSRLEVLDGSVQFVNRDDGKALVVNGGTFATAAKGGGIVARSLLAEPWQSQDIGEVGLRGVARLDGNNRCTAKGAGRNNCTTRDQFHFVYRTLDGDGEIKARVVTMELTHKEARAGVVIRESLKTGTPHAFLFLQAGGGMEFERRPNMESKTTRICNDTAPYWVRLARKGDVVTAFKSPDGVTWTKAGAETIRMGRRIYVGLGVTSWNNSTLATSNFDNVSVLNSSR